MRSKTKSYFIAGFIGLGLVVFLGGSLYAMSGPIERFSSSMVKVF